jgi:hypothetical protein
MAGRPASGRQRPPSGLGGGEHDASHHDQARDQPHQPGHLDVSQPDLPTPCRSARCVRARVARPAAPAPPPPRSSSGPDRR